MIFKIITLFDLYYFNTYYYKNKYSLKYLCLFKEFKLTKLKKEKQKPKVTLFIF